MQSPVWRRRALWAAGGLLIFWALAWALVPIIAKSQIEKLASAKLGRTVTLGGVNFKPWSLELAVNDLKIAKQDSPDAQLSIARIYIDAELESLLRLAPVVDAVAVDSPVVSLTHLGGGSYDVDDILEKLKTPPDAKPGEPPRFALYNLSLSSGQVSFSDKAVGKTHELTALNLSVPFLSNLHSKREVKTSPRLAFKLGGSNFDSAAEGTPFAQTHKTEATFKLSNFDLAPYLAYLPASLPYKLTGAVINADAKVAFEQNPGTVVRVSGVVTADKVRLLDKPGKDLLGFDQLKIVMDDVRPLAQSVKLSGIELTNPALNISRDRAGRLNLLPAAEMNAPKSGAGRARIQGAKGQNDAQKEAKTTSIPPLAAQTPWKVGIASIAVRGGTVNWLDETLAKPADVKLAAVTLDASKIAFPFAPDAPLEFRGSVALAASATTPATINFSGTATDQIANVSSTVAAWPLNIAARYVGQFLLPALGGQLDARLGITWQAAGTAKPQAIRITAPQVSLSDVLLAEGKTSLVSVKRIQVDGADIDLAGQSFKAAKLQVIQPKALVDRDADKRWMFERWLVENKTATPAPAPTTEATKANAPTWAVAIDEVNLAGGAMQFVDKAGSKPVAFDVNAVSAQLNNLVLDDKSSAKSLAARLMPLSASLRLTAGRFEPGKLNFKGNLGLTPMQVQGQLLAERLPIQAFEPYFADALNIELLRADASFKGKVAYKQTPAGASVQVNGDAALEELKANTLAPSEDLLDWKALSLRGLGVALEPGKPTRVDVQETVLSDFFARLIVLPDGRINLADLVKSGNATTSTVAGVTPVAIISGAARAQEQGATALNDAKKVPQTAVSGTSSTANAAIINFGPVSLVNGRVAFSDRFVKPNYSANLSDLTGKLSAFSSVPTGGSFSLADLELRGRAEGTASLEILGKLNPLAKPLALDITGKVRDLELPPLSPYAIKYSGYGITRGKMSVDVSYLVQPDGKLTAKNKLVLNQLSFGDKVEGSTASLPVKLAVALLADRNGVIDLDLPISGSLNDPQFSIGPIIIKVIINVIVKAITAPFSLLAAAFGGGGDELGTVAFPSGSAVLAPDAKAGLDKVAKALTDRPSLKLTVVGTSNLDAERDGYKRARLDELVRAEKRRNNVTGGGTATSVVTVSPAEYPALLKEVYKRADIAKPRSVIGLAKDLPVDDMEKLLLADIKVTNDAMQALALQRGVAVKEYLASKDLPLERLFLGAGNSGKTDAKAQAKPDTKWVPRADLNIAM
ncbi:MAG: DUF748 domain-containing protein [Polaromonas sp.]